MEVLKNRFQKGLMGAGKAGGNAESVYLVPPQNADLLQSSAILKSIDLISEGPIEGLCLQNGEKAEGINILSALYFNDVPIKQSRQSSFTKGGFSAQDIQLVDRVSHKSINRALININTNITNYQDIGDNSSGLAEITKANIADLQIELSELFSNFDEYESLVKHLGIIQFNISGVIPSESSSLYANTTSPIYASFILDDFKHERYIKADNGETVIKIPENIFAFAPDFDGTDTKIYDFSVFEFQRVKNFIGGGILFFYIGDEVATGSAGEFLTGKFLIEADDVAGITNAKNAGYDVLGTGDSFVEFLNVTHGQVSPSFGETIGKSINFGVNIDTNLRFNFNNLKFNFNDGNEFQKEIEGYGEIKRDYLTDFKLIGPFTTGGDANASGTFIDQFGNNTTYLKVGGGNTDIRKDGSFSGDFAAWNTAEQAEHDAYEYTHIIYQTEVDSIIPTIRIDLLRDTESTNDDTLGRTEPAGLALEFVYGFEGDYEEADVENLLSQGVYVKNIALSQFRESEKAGYYGVSEGNYLNSPYEIELPKNSLLKNLKISDIEGIDDFISDYGLNADELVFPNGSWKDINRYLKVKKISFETESALIQRECSIVNVTEKINSKFYYPFCSLGAITLDARNFGQIPIRSYDVKLKKILVPSNYAPLKAGGEDKRFLDSASVYGLRSVQTFNGSTYAIVPGKIDLGSDNYEISFKAKIPNAKPSNVVYFFDSDRNNRVFLKLSTAGLLQFRCNGGQNVRVDIGAYSGEILNISCKRIGSKSSIKVIAENLTVLSDEVSAELVNNDIPAQDLAIGARSCASQRLKDGTQIADFKIKKNNQLLHHWDGTIINTNRSGTCLKDRFGGNHAKITGTVNAVEDTNFEFGRNKEQIYIGNWDGSLKYAWSDNPAWILYDLLVNPIYGIRNQIDDLEDIDIFELYQIGRYCDGVDEDGYFDGVSDERGGLEPRFSCNLWINEKENAFNVIGNIASIFRAVSYWAGGSFNFSVDRPKKPSAIFNNSNVLDGSFNYGDISKESRFTRVEVFYADKRDNFKIKKEFIEDEDGIRKFGLITNTQNGIGSTSRSQARRIGKYVLLSNKLETEIVEFSTDTSALLLSPGDVIKVDDELKGFEMNYGKLLGVNMIQSDPYVEIENSINIDNIKTGDGSSLFLYGNQGQSEIQSLYDIVKFDQNYQFGEDQDQYSGSLSPEKIDSAYVNFVFETKVTGLELTNNNRTIKLKLDISSEDVEKAEGIQLGSQFNLKLKNNVENYFKIVSVKEQESNIYQVTALQHESGKFENIEIEDFQDIQEFYNIGVINNSINRPSPPSGVSFKLESDENGIRITGNITGVLGSQESKYRVSLDYPNGVYTYKEFLKDTDSSPPVTRFSFFNLNQVGNYNLKVTSLKNPESAEGTKYNFYVDGSQMSSELFFKEIIMRKEANSTHEKRNGINYKTGESITSNDFFDIRLENENRTPIYFNSYFSPYVRIKIFDNENNFLKYLGGKQRSENFHLSKLQKEECLKDLRKYSLGFYLYKNDDVLCDTFMYSVLNKAPQIKFVDLKTYQNKIIFNLKTENSLDITAIEIHQSKDSENFKKIKTENVNFQNGDFVLPLFYEELNDYGMNYYKFVAKDIIGTGEFSETVSGKMEIPETNQAPISLSSVYKQIDQSLVSVYFAQFDENLNLKYSSNGSNSFEFKEFEDGRKIGYNVILDCSYYTSGSQQERFLRLDEIAQLNLSSTFSEQEVSSYKKNKKSIQDYETKEFNFLIENDIGLRIEQVNLEIEKYYQ